MPTVNMTWSRPFVLLYSLSTFIQPLLSGCALAAGQGSEGRLTLSCETVDA